MGSSSSSPLVDSTSSFPPPPPPILSPPHRSPLLSNRISSSLLGIAIGDSVGLHVEGNPFSVVRSHLKEINQWMESMDFGKIFNILKESNNYEFVTINGEEKSILALKDSIRSSLPPSLSTSLSSDSPLGTITDDTQLTREIILSILLNTNGNHKNNYPSYSSDSFTRRLLILSSEHRLRGSGFSTATALTALSKGTHWSKSGVFGAGNGSSMRAIAIGYRYVWRGLWDRRGGMDSEEDENERTLFVSICREQAKITHKDPRCSAGAVAMAMATSLLLSSNCPAMGEQKNKEIFMTETSDVVGTVDAKFGMYLRSLLPLMSEIQNIAEKEKIQRYQQNVRGKTFGFSRSHRLSAFEMAEIDRAEELKIFVNKISPIGMDALPQDVAKSETAGGTGNSGVGISCFVISSVLWSLLCFLRNPDGESIWETIQWGMEGGGDTDSTSAMIGGLKGAYWGWEGMREEDGSISIKMEKGIGGSRNQFGLPLLLTFLLQDPQDKQYGSAMALMNLAERMSELRGKPHGMTEVLDRVVGVNVNVKGRVIGDEEETIDDDEKELKKGK